MNTETYEQTHLRNETLGETIEYLVPNLKITVEFYDGKPVAIQLPATVDPGSGGDGAVAERRYRLQHDEARQVGDRTRRAGSPFVNTGDRVRVNTAEGTYQERAQ